jgi:signal transduction histidine kinase
LLAATLRWNWRGALVTASLLATVFVAVALLFGSVGSVAYDDLNRTIVRTGYLLVAGGMLGYVGAYKEQSRRRIAQLAAWPVPERDNPPEPDLGHSVPLVKAFAHSAQIMRGRRVLVIWEQAEEPFRHVALWSESGLEYSRERADRFGKLVAEDYADAAVSIAGSPRSGTLAGVGQDRPPSIIDDDLQRSYGIRDALTAPFCLPLCSGRAFILDRYGSSDDDLQLVALVSMRLGVEFEHLAMRAQVEEAAMLAERGRLAHDLHDSTLQSLAAANINLKMGARQAGGDLADHLTRIRQNLIDEQRRIRDFVEEHRSPVKKAQMVHLAEEVTPRLQRLEHEWDCKIELHINPPDPKMRLELAHHARHLLTEAVSNAVRHGGASRVVISVASCPPCLEIRVSDNGRGFEELNGEYDDAAISALRVGPRSLHTRVKKLHGKLSLRTGPTGSELTLEMPL